MTQKQKKESFFWTSYSDLMTSLFFIMLVLFILTITSLRHASYDLIIAKEEAEKARRVSEQQLAKIKEIEEGLNNIDPKWFRYEPAYKKHVLKIDVEFETGSSDITDIPEETRSQLHQAGESILKFLRSAHDKYNVKYLLVIEGQASKDSYIRNYELSYERALSLVNYWIRICNLDFDLPYCELLIAGSGQSGTLRIQPDNATNKANQRFLIHIIPKPGIIEANKSQQ